MRWLVLLLALLASPALAQQFPNMGMNSPGICYYCNTTMYADAFLQTQGNNGRWDTADGQSAAPLDATGAPTVDGATTNFSANYAGNMTLSWDGVGQVIPDGGCSAGSVTVSGSHRTQTVNCPIVNTQGNGGAQNVSYYQFTANPPVTNIHMTVAAAATCGGMWVCDFINQSTTFKNIRWMKNLNVEFDGFDGTGITQVMNWSDRTWPSEGSRGGTRGGMAYEDIINFSNYTGKSAWINVPGLATDDYVCRLARLFAYGEVGDKLNTPCSPTAIGRGTVPPLNSNITLYVEYSNEPWNWGYAITSQLYCWANGIGPDGTLDSCPTGNTTPPSFYARQQLNTAAWGANGFFNGDQYGKQLATQLLFTYRDLEIFREVFNAAGRPNQVKHVLNVQSFNGGNAGYYIQNFWVPTYGENPAEIMAFAPYLGLNCPNSDPCPGGPRSGDNTVDLVFSDLQNTYTNGAFGGDPSQGLPAELQDNINQAAAVNMTMAAYEGSVSWASNDYTQVEIDATNDPRMKTTTLMYLNGWLAKAGPNILFNYFQIYSAWGPFGNWGSKANQADACSQNWSALMELTGGKGCTP